MAKGVIGSDLHFYPRPPGGGRPERATHFCCYPRFLSTPSGWRATSVKSGSSSCEIFLSTPSGWRATFVHIKFLRSFYSISIHALRVEGDAVNVKSFFKIRISIHALRVEGDVFFYFSGFFDLNFYPRPPGGGRQQKRTKFSSVFAQKGEEFASLRRGKRKICRWRFKKDKFWVLIWCEGSGKSVCALASHCG